MSAPPKQILGPTFAPEWLNLNGHATVTPKDRVYDFSFSTPALKSSGKRKETP